MLFFFWASRFDKTSAIDMLDMEASAAATDRPHRAVSRGPQRRKSLPFGPTISAFLTLDYVCPLPAGCRRVVPPVTWLEI